MGTDAGDLDYRHFWHEARAFDRGRQRLADRRGGRLAHRPAALADQERDRRIRPMVADACQERVAALDAMDEAVLAQELERPIDRDWRRTRARVRRLVHDLVGAERLVARGEG